MLESELINTLNTISNKEGVKGVLVADEKGFCLGARGIAKHESAAFITSIANSARQFDSTQDDKVEYPTVNIEYENNHVIIRNEGNFTLAIFM
ncbi:hypothetical protein K501DRAFT_293925 [Backusella circina FSU 941]|nr:hypothetical protein K501DRAFT_293925 [Backusella circina FSU 941]